MSCMQRVSARPRRVRRFSSVGKSIPRIVGDEADDEGLLILQLASYYEKQQPVIFRMQSDALHKWVDWDYLTKKVDDNWVGEVEMGAYNQGQRITISFREYMEYLKLWKQHEEEKRNDLPASLHDDIRLPSIAFAENKWYNMHWWVGPRETNSPLHFDALDNFLLQIVGKKSVVLFDKSQAADSLYAGSRWGQQANTSAADVFDLDRSLYPDLDLEQCYMARLEPGDALYIPSKWWHAVRSLSFSISVNAWWR